MSSLVRVVTQPRQKLRYASLIEDARLFARWTNCDCAFAYATRRGVELFLDEWGPHGPPARSRWLMGVDWFRTEPAALEQLRALPGSDVRIANGQEVLARKNCTPKVCFHPKSMVLRSKDALALLTGSGNMSRSGLSKGHEWGTLLAVRGARSKVERDIATEIRRTKSWFERLWRDAVPLNIVLEEYDRRYRSVEHLRFGLPNEEELPADLSLRGRGRTVSVEMIRKMGIASHFWVEAGKLTKNLGKGRPGNQLMMSPMSRVFFGYPAQVLETNNKIGTVQVRYAGLTVDRPLRFSDNAMEVLSLPMPGAHGPRSYDGKTLLFERKRDYFELTVGSRAEAAAWRAESAKIDGIVVMSGKQRRWGVF